MLDKDTNVIRGISTEESGKTYIDAKYWGGYETNDIKTIGGKSIFRDSNNSDTDIIIHSNSVKEINYSDLKASRDNAELIPGIQYRITDYVTTTSQENTQSEGHRFDIIVTADSNDTLNEVARACRNIEDTYFNNSNLDVWEIKYCLDNDTTRFSWADETNGKGVIYYMKDEFDNELYYDFKNIKYVIPSYQYIPEYEYKYAFTFTNSFNGEDLSLTQNVRNNSVKKFVDSKGVQLINGNIFLCEDNIYNNVIGDNSSNNLICVSSFYYNNIGVEFQNNIFSDVDNSKISVHNNVIGDLFKQNEIKYAFNSNKIGNSLLQCVFNSQFVLNNVCDYYNNIKFNYHVSYCDFGSHMYNCVFENIDSYTPLYNEMKWCVFEGGLYNAQSIPSFQRVTFQKALHTEESEFNISEIKLLDGRILSDVLTGKHDENLYVYRVGDKFAVYKNGDEKIKTLTPLFSNPNLELESSENNVDAYGYVGSLYNLDVFGDNILVDSIGVYVKEGSDSQNLDVPVWCRLLKFTNGTWEIIYQSETCKAICEVDPESLFTFKMVNKSNNPFIKNTDKIAIVYVSSEDSDILSNVQLGVKSVSKSGGLSSVIADDSVGSSDWSPAFVIGYTSSMGFETFELNLGEFSNIDGVSSKASEIDVCSNQSITRMSFKIDNGANGFIEQFITENSRIIDGVEYYYIVQTLCFDGETSSRQISYTVNNNIKTINVVGNWNKIIDHNNDIEYPILYSKNSEVVNIESDQTITGNKQFNKDINLGGKTLIKSGDDIDDGQLKVFSANDNTYGFILQTGEKFDSDIPKLELVGTGNGKSYKYQFPQLKNEIDEVVVKSQFDEIVEVIKENEKVTAVALNNLNELANNIGDLSINPLINITYSELVYLRDSFSLTPGMQYRIIDYVTTTSQENTKSAGHQFDIIVTADSENTLNSVARACLNSNDTYFSDSNSNLYAWKIWYHLDNDINMFDWASEEGKGVIYRMIDEWGNDCPYDFKNIQFLRDDVYLYTFSWKDAYGLIHDTSIEGNNGELKYYLGIIKGVYNNIIGVRKNYVYVDNDRKLVQSLNDIVFLSTNEHNDGNFSGCYSNTFGVNCYSNTFGDNCYSNTFGDNCYSNTFGYNCYSNTFGKTCNSNTFGYNCYSNTFGERCCSNTFEGNCYSNTFGFNCCSNVFGRNCYSNTFGDNCDSNTFGNACKINKLNKGCDFITFGNYCENNNLGEYCVSNTFGDNCDSNEFGSYCSSNTFGNNCCGNSFVTFDDKNNNKIMDRVKNVNYGNSVSKVMISISENIKKSDKHLQNISIPCLQPKDEEKNGINVNIDVVSQLYELIISRDSGGNIKTFCLADLLK